MNIMSIPQNNDRVSCLIVTANRHQLLRRSLLSLKKQTYPSVEVVIIDNGDEPVENLLDQFSFPHLTYEYIPPPHNFTLGDLRNRSLDLAGGEYMICWDDDDWFHPQRIEVQYETLKSGYDACCLEGTIFHIDTPELIHHPYIGRLPKGSPSSIMHRRNDLIRYPSLNREEDTEYLNRWRCVASYKKLGLDYAYLFVRVFHGENVSGKKHFLRRLRNSPMSWAFYMWYAKITNNLTGHPKFRLSEKEEESFRMFLNASKEVDLFTP
jgi:glycosyltransferase involved in cell wall biosynthesis